VNELTAEFFYANVLPVRFKQTFIMIKDNILEIQKSIAAICQRLGRNPDEITLIGVTKLAPVDKIKESIQAGIRHVGENKVQEGQSKYPALQELGIPVTRHMIGHLQTNKVKHALEYFDIIESVDSFKLAQEIEKQAVKRNKVAEILVQINTAAEEQKYGATKDDALTLVDQIAQLEHVRVLGLMVIAPFTDDKERVRKCFRDLKDIRDQVAAKYKNNERVQMKYLSMGMSEDYEIALEEGSNMVRIGRAIYHK
jgi:PLP dependent protein